MDDTLIVFSGTISHLQVIPSESNQFLNQENRRLGALATLGLAAIGESGSAATSLQHASGEDIKLELFRCEIDGKTIYGCFSRVFFADGEEADIVAEPQKDGGFYAYAVRRPIDHKLWLYPHSGQGRKAYRAKNNKMSFMAGILCFLFLLIISFIQFDFGSKAFFIFVFSNFIVSLSISIFMYFYFGNKDGGRQLFQKKHLLL